MPHLRLATPVLLALVCPLAAAAQDLSPSPTPSVKPAQPPAKPAQPTAKPAQPAAVPAQPAKPAEPSPAALSADMAATLRKAGFTDLQIMPNAVFVRGKDKTGNPVAMVLDPSSMTDMVTLDPHSGSAAGGHGEPTLTGSATFAAVLPSERLASRIIGTDVVDKAGTVLGTIRDIAIDHGGVHAYVLRVGGLLGIGERFVAVTPTAITLASDQGTGRYSATMDATPDQLKAAPAFEYGDLDTARK